jgi:hypothetical protein
VRVVLGPIGEDQRLTGIHDVAIFVEMSKCKEDAANEAFNHPDWHPATLTEKRRVESLQAEGKRFRDDTEMFGSGTSKDEFVAIDDSRKGCGVI